MSDAPTTTDRVWASCPVCDRADTSAALNVQDHLSLEWFTVHRCPGCGMQFVKDPPRPDRLGGYYDNEMGAIMHSKPGYLFTNARRIRIAKDLAPLAARLPKGTAVIDHGTGDGSAAVALRELGFVAGAADVYPADAWSHPDIPYRRFEPGRPATRDDFLVGAVPAAGLVLRHVLEHEVAPRDFLRAAHDAGVTAVLVIVPNVDSGLARRLGARWYYWEPPRHLSFFSPDTLRSCANAAGFAVAELRTYGIDELVTSAFRAAAIKRAGASGRGQGRWSRVAALTRPTGLLAGVSSALSTPIAKTVCHALLVAR